MAGPLAGRVTRVRLAAGTAASLLIAVAGLGWAALPAIVCTATATLAAGFFFRRRLGGITGDCLGATQQLVELTVLLALAARLPSWP